MKKTNKEDFSQRDSWQISVHKNSEALVELNSMLQPSAPNRPWRLHAERKDGDEWSSLIRIVLVGYKDKENSVNVYANVRPEDVKYLYSRVWNSVKEFSYSQQKIFCENEKATDGTVTVLKIQRHEKNSHGEVLNNPWNIQIENGTGKMEKNKSGGKYCKRGSFICEAQVSINLSDQDFFALFARANAAIEAFEHDQMSRRRNAQNFKLLYKKMEKMFYGNQEERYAA